VLTGREKPHPFATRAIARFFMPVQKRSFTFEDGISLLYPKVEFFWWNLPFQPINEYPYRKLDDWTSFYFLSLNIWF